MSRRWYAASAQISADGLYRYSLERKLIRPSCEPQPTILFCGLNPSTADGEKDDPTIRREIDFALRFGFERLLKVNLYAWRATKPKAMWAALRAGHNIVGPENAETIDRLVKEAELVVCAWGNQQPLGVGGNALAAWLLAHQKARCLGVNYDGSPRHPLFVPKATQLQAIR